MRKQINKPTAENLHDEGEEEQEEEEEQAGFVEWNRQQNVLNGWGAGAYDIDLNTIRHYNLLLKVTRELGREDDKKSDTEFETLDDGRLFRSDDSPVLPANLPIVFGRYKPIRLIGEGTFSQIVEARDLLHEEEAGTKEEDKEEAGVEEKKPFEQSRVAIKIMKAIPGQDEATIIHSRIGLQEAKWLNRLKLLDKNGSSGIIDLKGTFQLGTHYCLVLELAGPSLYERIVNHNNTNNPNNNDPHPFSLPEICMITAKVLAALAFLHNNNVMHADIKPENIVFADTLGEGRRQTVPGVKLIDFGNAMSVAEAEEQYRSAILNDTAPEVQSIPYRAPEVVWRHPFDTKIDMWSLGCVLYEMCTAKPLFDPSKKVSAKDGWMKADDLKAIEDMKALLDDELVLLMVDLLGTNAIAVTDSAMILVPEEEIALGYVKEEEEEEEEAEEKEKGKKAGGGGGKTKGTTTKKRKEKIQPQSERQGGGGGGGTHKRKRKASVNLKVDARGQLSLGAGGQKRRKISKGKEEEEGEAVRPAARKHERDFTDEWLEMVVANPEMHDGIRFEKGAAIHILERANDDYWLCFYRGRKGLVSVADLEIQSPYPEEEEENEKEKEKEEGTNKGKGKEKEKEKEEEEWRREQYNLTHRKLMKAMNTKNHLFVDLVQKLLHYDPKRRLSPQEALLHPFLSSFFPFLSVFNNQSYSTSLSSLREKTKEEEEPVIPKAEKEKSTKNNKREVMEEEVKRLTLKREEEMKAECKSQKVRIKKKKKQKLREMENKLLLDKIKLKGVIEREYELKLEAERQRILKETGQGNNNNSKNKKTDSKAKEEEKKKGEAALAALQQEVQKLRKEKQEAVKQAQAEKKLKMQLQEAKEKLQSERVAERQGYEVERKESLQVLANIKKRLKESEEEHKKTQGELSEVKEEAERVKEEQRAEQQRWMEERRKMEEEADCKATRFVEELKLHQTESARKMKEADEEAQKLREQLIKVQAQKKKKKGEKKLLMKAAKEKESVLQKKVAFLEEKNKQLAVKNKTRKEELKKLQDQVKELTAQQGVLEQELAETKAVEAELVKLWSSVTKQCAETAKRLPQGRLP